MISSFWQRLVSITLIIWTAAAASEFGNSFNLEKIEVEGVISGGKSVFLRLDPSCRTKEKLKETTTNHRVYTDHEEFVHEVAATVGLTAKEIGGKGSINTKYLKKSSTETSGTMVEVVFLRNQETISSECLEESDLAPSILHDLKMLPYPVKKPHVRGNWLPYDAFTHKWGSHILKSTQSGAKAIYHTTRMKKSTTDKKELELKLCAKFPELNLDGCVEAGPKISSSTSSEDETNEVFVMGGSTETQDKLREGAFTPELLEKLGEEAEAHQAPIKHEWFSLPELLLNRLMFHDDRDYFKRATALLSYYKGFHVFGCDHQQHGGRHITLFVNAGDDEYPDFKCLQVPPGCQVDADCRNWPISYLGPCYCAGDTCMAVRKEGKKREKALELELRRTVIGGGYKDLTNARCYVSTRGCVCQPAKLEEVWPLGSVLLQAKAPKKSTPWGLICFVSALVILLAAVVIFVKAKSTEKTNTDKAKTWKTIAYWKSKTT